MAKRLTRALIVCAAFACAAPAFAQPTFSDLIARFSSGGYMEAASDAEHIGGADELAFAARCLLATAMTGEHDPDPAVVDRATRNAEAALKIDPSHEEGQLQLAIALSLKARAMGVIDAWNAGYGQRGKQLATSVLKQDPGNFYAHGFLAVWNIEARRRGGKLAGSLMGANVEDGRRHYHEAARLAPDDIGVHWQWARALTALDAKRYGAEAADALARAVAARADDHIDEVMQARAVKLAEALKGDRRAAQQLALTML